MTTSHRYGRTPIGSSFVLFPTTFIDRFRAAGKELFFHTWDEPSESKDGKSRRAKPREIDFLVMRGFSDAAGKLRICPIEVKSGKRYSTVSLDDFKKRWPKCVGEEWFCTSSHLKSRGTGHT